MQKIKSLNLGPKTPDLHIFGLEFENIIVIFEISTLDSVKVWCKKQEFLNLGPKMFDLGSFWLEFENNIVVFEISNLEFV